MVKVRLDKEIWDLQKDPEFRAKLRDRIDASNGWGGGLFRFKGRRIVIVDQPDGNYYAYQEHPEHFKKMLGGGGPFEVIA